MNGEDDIDSSDQTSSKKFESNLIINNINNIIMHEDSQSV